MDCVTSFVGRVHVHPRERDQPAINHVVVASDQGNTRYADEGEPIALDVPVLEMGEMKLSASHLVARNVADREPESPELIVPCADKGFSHHIGIETGYVQFRLFLLRLPPTSLPCPGVSVAERPRSC